MIRLRGVSLVYPNGTRALDDVDLEIEKGSFVFLVGHSGTGKSSLLKLLYREELPSGGDVVIADLGNCRILFVRPNGHIPVKTLGAGPTSCVHHVLSAPLTFSRPDAAFPSFDGNGMYVSMGNVLDTRAVGMLFIDFENQTRLRVEGDATIDLGDPLLAGCPEAQFIVRVKARAVFPNCPRYIHKMQLVERSRFTPKAGCIRRLSMTAKIKGRTISLAT